MYVKLSKREVYTKIKDAICIREFSISEKHCFICTDKGTIFRKMKTGYWKEIVNKKNHNKGYNVILVDKKQYSRSKLILFAYNKISLENKNKNIYHKNSDRLDCRLDNLTMTPTPTLYEV